MGDSQDITIGIGLIVLLIFSLAIHEAAHAFVAYKRGDNTAKSLGRLTLNPIPHIDFWWTILMPALLFFSTNGAFVFGGAKPVPVNPYNLRNPGRDMALVALAGPMSNLIIACVLALFLLVMMQQNIFLADSVSARILQNTIILNIVLAVFNMVPIPPLDGSRVMAYLLPQNLSEQYVKLEFVGIFILLGLMFTGAFVPLFNTTVFPMYNGIMSFWQTALGLS